MSIASNSTNMDSNSSDSGETMAWFLPTFMAVFMVIFLFVSFILHHRRFRGRHKRKELMEYYLELHVEGGLRRIAAPTTSSSMRTKELEENDSVDNKPPVVNFVARASIDSAFSIAMSPYGTDLQPLKKKLKNGRKVRHRDSGLFSFLTHQPKWPPPSEKPNTISESVTAESKNNLNANIGCPLPPISPAPSPSKRRRHSPRELVPSPTPVMDLETAMTPSEGASSSEKPSAILLSAKALPEVNWLERTENDHTPV